MATIYHSAFIPRSARWVYYEYEFEFIRQSSNVELLIVSEQRPLPTLNLLPCFEQAKQAIPVFIKTCFALDILTVGFQTEKTIDVNTIYDAVMTALTQPYFDLEALMPGSTDSLRAITNKIKTNGVVKIGFVYLMHYSKDIYKIGMSAKPQNRLSELSTASPHRLSLECTIHSIDMAQLENELHNRFDHKRIRAEWFRLSPQDVQFFHALADGMDFQAAEVAAYQTEFTLPLFTTQE